MLVWGLYSQYTDHSDQGGTLVSMARPREAAKDEHIYTVACMMGKRCSHSKWWIILVASVHLYWCGSRELVVSKRSATLMEATGEPKFDFLA